jgi:hypothetical protein
MYSVMCDGVEERQRWADWKMWMWWGSAQATTQHRVHVVWGVAYLLARAPKRTAGQMSLALDEGKLVKQREF